MGGAASAAPATRKAGLFHRFGGQLCGKPLSTARAGPDLLVPVLFAAFLGAAFLFRIMGLRSNDVFVTGVARGWARRRALVEFSVAAAPGLGRG
jgi:hypothetical protein